MKISQLASSCGVGVETVRFYQRIGLLATPRQPPRGYREYTAEDVARLRFVRRAQELGFTLEEISALVELSASNCRDAESIASERLVTVREKIADLQRVAKVLSDVVTQCEARKPHQGCPIIETLTEI